MVKYTFMYIITVLMKKGKGCLTFLLIITAILVLIPVGLYFSLKSSKNIDVSWTEKDYESYKSKVGAGSESPGNFNLLSISKGYFTSSGKRNVNLTFTSEEISSVLSNENAQFGPIKDIKVKFLNNNEAEATFKLTDKMDQYVKRTSETLERYPFLKNSLNNQPVYLKAKVERSSNNSISADIQTISVGRFPLPDRVVNIVENSAVPEVNNMIKKYNGLSIEELKFEDGKMKFKGSIPKEIKTTISVVN